MDETEPSATARPGAGVDAADLRLDGNAAGGALAEIFGGDVTVALATCAHCATTAALATAVVYVHAPGLVLRCSACDGVILRLVRLPGRMLVDLAGTRTLELGG